MNFKIQYEYRFNKINKRQFKTSNYNVDRLSMVLINANSQTAREQETNEHQIRFQKSNSSTLK